MLGLFFVQVIANLRSHPKMSKRMKHYFRYKTPRHNACPVAGLIDMVSLEFRGNLDCFVTYKNTKLFLRSCYFGSYIVLGIFHAVQGVF